MSPLLIENARLFCPSTESEPLGQLLIKDGRIAPVTEADENTERFDAKGLTLAPGLVDLFARLREPGQEHKGSIKTESHAALQGGVTQILCSPEASPPVDVVAAVKLIFRRAIQAQGAHVLPIGAMTRALAGEQLSEMATLAEAGCVAMGQGDQPLHDLRVLRRAMEYATSFGLMLVIQPSEPSLVHDTCAHASALSSTMGLNSQTSAAESVSVAKHIELARVTGARLHFNRISSARGVQLIEQAKAEGLAISADVSIHQLLLNEAFIAGYNPLYRLTPPLRSAEDQAALIEGLDRGVIDALCSDHAPHEADAKTLPFAEAAPGISCLDHYLSLLYLAAEHTPLSLETLWRAASDRACKVFNLPHNTLAVGQPANVVLFDPQASYTAQAATMLSKGKNSPYLGQQLQARVERVWIHGEQRALKRPG